VKILTKWDDIQKGIDALNKGKRCPFLKARITIVDLIDTFFPELKTDGEFDYALPQDWADDVAKVTDVYPTKNFVWFYPKRELVDKYGASELPYPLDRNGINTLKQYNEKTGYNYPVPSE
jgi:hypothetical protein